MDRKEPLSDLISQLWNQRRRRKVPVISRQVQPAPNGARSQLMADPSDPLSGAVPVSSLRERHVNICIYGTNRVGKTSLGCQFEKPLLIESFEPGIAGGSGSVRNEPGVSFIRVTSREQAIAIARRLASDPRSCWHLRDGKWWPHLDSDGRPVSDGAPFASHLLDSVTTLQDTVLQSILGLDKPLAQLGFGKVSKEQYQERAEKSKEVMQFFRDLDANTIFLALEKDHNKEGWEKNPRSEARLGSFFGPDLGEGTAKWMYNACDHICQLYMAKETRVIPGQPIEVSPGVFTPPGEPTIVETGRQVRRLRTLYHCNYMAGSRSGNWRNVPEYVEAPSPEETYQDIMRIVRGERAKHGHYPEETK